MFHHSKPLPRGLVMGVVLAGLCLAGPSRAADPVKPDNSLRLVPADAAFYSASLRNREQFAVIAKSKAWNKLTSLSAIQTFWKKTTDDLAKPDGPLAQFEAFRKVPGNQELLDLLVEMVSSEIFVYGDENVGDAFELYSRVSGARYKALAAMARGEVGPTELDEAQALYALKALNESHDLIKAPELVIGFKVSDADKAEAQIKRLETLVKAQIDGLPDLKRRLKRVPVGNGKSFLTFTVDGNMIPWDQIPVKQGEKVEAEYAKLKKQLQQTTLTVSLGVREQYLVLGIGGSSKHLLKMGKGPSLAERPEFRPMSPYASKPIIDVSYVSKSFLSKVGYTKKDLDAAMDTAREALKSAPVPEELRKRLDTDLDALAKDLRSSIPDPGAKMSFGFLTETGQESYSFDWCQHPGVDGSKPLSLTDHLGGNPLAAAVGRGKSNPGAYKTFVKWIKTINGYAVDFLVPMLDDEKKEAYERITKVAYPLLKRLDLATGTMLLPAFTDGQTALVIDARWTSKSWFPEQPASEKALPMLELGLLMGVSDAELLKKGANEYREVINDAILLANAGGAGLPEIKIPSPLTKKLKAGTMYYYTLPEVPGLDKRVQPNAALSDKVLVLSLSEACSDRLLSKKPLKTECDLLLNVDRPLVSMSYFNWAGTVDALAPWVELGISQAPIDAQAQISKDEIRKQAAVVLEVLKAFRCVGTITYLEDKALVTHSQTVVRDLK